MDSGSSYGKVNKIRDVFEHRRLSNDESGMTVRIFNSTFVDIHQYGFEAVSNSGNLYMFNVSMKKIQGSVLTNILGGSATLESCVFESIDAVSLIRAVNSSLVDIRDTMFMDNVATVSISNERQCALLRPVPCSMFSPGNGNCYRIERLDF